MRKIIIGAVLCLGVAGCGGTTEPAAPTSAAPPAASPSATGSAAPAPEPAKRTGKPFDVTLADMTIHSFSTRPETNSGGYRMNCSPQWAQVETRRGDYDWTQFDQFVARAESWGATSLLYTFCGTPKWAATKVKDPSREVLGPGTTSAPQNVQDFADYAGAVAERYRGRIEAYEVWNEASSPQFWQGTPEQMAEMTAAAYKAIKKADPKAIVTAASTQTHAPAYYDSFFPPYLAALQQLDWPVDVWNGHFYPAGKTGPAARRAQIEMVQQELKKAGAPDLPLWDTETNYYVGLPGGEPDGRVTGDRAAAWPVRTYLDGWRMNVARNYWYFWTVAYEAFAGIQTRVGDPSTAALANFSNWVVGSRFQGCTEDKQIVSCDFSKDGDDFVIAWAEGKDDSDEPRASYPLKGSVEACSVADGSCTTTKSLTLDLMPTRISAAD